MRPRDRVLRGVAAAAMCSCVLLALTARVDQAGATAARATSMCGTKTVAPKFKHVILIVDENHSYGTIFKSSSAPYLNKVMSSCGLATNFHNITHSSLPNYLGLAYGGSLSDLSPYVNDCTPTKCSHLINSDNVFHQLATRGWKSFDESMPAPCYRSNNGNYAPKHNPAVYFNDLSGSCFKRDLPLGTTNNSPLLRALSAQSKTPAFSFVTPNLCDDMHNCSISTGDNWMKTWLPLIVGSKTYKGGNTAVIIVWDEGEPGYVSENCVSNSSDQSCHVAAIVVAPSVHPGTKVSTSFSHYSILKTVEDLLGLPELGGAQSATSMVSGFNL